MIISHVTMQESLMILLNMSRYRVRFRVNAKVERSIQREETLTRKQP